MKRILMTFMVSAVGLLMIAPDVSAQSDKTSKQTRMDQWQKDMAEFRNRSAADRHLGELVDSIASEQARAAIRDLDFVLMADNMQFRNGPVNFVNSSTNFISVKGNRAVVQIAPNSFVSGPNGMGGVTVDGYITGQEVKVDKKGRTVISMNVSGVGVNAQVEIYMSPDSDSANATVYPNLNSNILRLQGKVVPYENANIIVGRSL